MPHNRKTITGYAAPGREGKWEWHPDDGFSPWGAAFRLWICSDLMAGPTVLYGVCAVIMLLYKPNKTADK